MGSFVTPIIVGRSEELRQLGATLAAVIDEKRIGREQFKFQAERDWAQTETLGFNFTWHWVSAAGPVAWVAAEGLGQGKVGGQEMQFPLRMTGVLEQRGDEWFLVQSHISLPAPGQEEGDSVPV